jgi:hypothetical protein
MRPDTDTRHSPPIPQQHAAALSATEAVDLDDPQAVSRAIALHQAGKAVFAVPFGSVGRGTLTWLDPRMRDSAASARG